MTMYVQLAIFAIESGVKLGKKIYDVLVDKTVEKPLILPVGELYADPEWLDVNDFFLKRPDLRAPGGPYHELSRDEEVLAYKTLTCIEESLPGADAVPPGDRIDEAVNIVRELNRLEQFTEDHGSKPPVQRILGTLVEIGIDYFSTHPEAMGRDSKARKVVKAFVEGLDEVDFAEAETDEIIADLFGAALETLGAGAALIDDNERARAILGGIAESLSADVEARGLNEYLNRKELFKRIGSSLIRGAAGAFTENIDLFVRKETPTKEIVKSALDQVLKGIEGKENLFTTESLELIYKSALTAIGENPELLSDNTAVQDLIAGTVDALTRGKKVFSEETFRAVVENALRVAADHAEMLIDPDNPREQLLADAVTAVADGLSSTLAGGGTAADLLSRTQLVELSRAVFNEVAENPEHLLGTDSPNVKETALAQIIGSVARALGENPGLLVTGDGVLRLMRGAIRVTILNADKLIDPSKPGTKNNLLFKVLNEVASVIKDEDNDPRGIVTREVFLEIVGRVLPVVSANVEPLLDDDASVVGQTIMTALELASGVFENRTNGANLPILIEGLLRKALWGELDLEEQDDVKIAAKEMLRAAA